MLGSCRHHHYHPTVLLSTCACSKRGNYPWMVYIIDFVSNHLRDKKKPR